ncbi:MAG: 7TM diverse intracellular signaling domain-containing protein, partial [Flammeovirgaceae bacterium]
MLLLNIRTYRPGIAKVLNSIILFFVALLISAPFLHQQYLAAAFVIVPLVLSLAMVGMVLLLWCAVTTLRHQREIAAFFLVAYMLIAVTSAMMVMEDYGWIEKLPFNALFLG